MKWKTWILPFGALVLLGGCEAQAPSEMQTPATAGAARTAPEEASPAARLERIRTELDEVTSEMNQAGEYNCCVHPVCTWCALHEGNCTCFDNLQAGEEVCPGCGLGWHNGEGVVDGVEADDVKWNITHEHPPSGGHAH